MNKAASGEVTRMLTEIAEGNDQARQALFECVYRELHEMAAQKMRHERIGHTLGATGLVHEVYMRLVGGAALERNRRYFFAAAGRAMYQILVDHARKSQRHHQNRSPLDQVLQSVESILRVEVLDVHAALERLKGLGPRGRRMHEVVMQRYWAGLPWKEIAANLNAALATVEKDWQAARAWLYKQLHSKEQP